MNTILTKLKDFVGLNEEDYEYYEEDVAEENYQTPPQQEIQQRSQREPLRGAQQEEERINRRRTRERNRETISAGVEAAMTRNANRSNVIGMPGIANSVSEVVIIEPHSFEEMPQVIQTLRERRSVVLNLNTMDPEEAQRAVDFVAGGTYALDGHQERIGESIFLFAPSCVKVSTFSGIINEITPPQPETPPRQTAPVATHGWAPDATRIAQ